MGGSRWTYFGDSRFVKVNERKRGSVKDEEDNDANKVVVAAVVVVVITVFEKDKEIVVTVVSPRHSSSGQ
jgi:hypothetical protein